MDFVVANGEAILFYLFAALALAGALLVISLRNPMYGAIGLLLSFLAVAALFLLRRAEFLRHLQDCPGNAEGSAVFPLKLRRFKTVNATLGRRGCAVHGMRKCGAWFPPARRGNTSRAPFLRDRGELAAAELEVELSNRANGRRQPYHAPPHG